MTAIGLTILIIACLSAGACLGILAGTMFIAREASRSFALADARRRMRLEDLIGPETVSGQAEMQVRADSREAADTLEAFTGASDRPQNGLQRATAHAPTPAKGAPCLPCLRARRALLSAKRAIFGP